RYDGDFKKVIDHINDFQNIFDSKLLEPKHVQPKSILTSQEWVESSAKVGEVEKDYLKSRGLNDQILNNPEINRVLRKYAYENKKGYVNDYLAFPLINKDLECTGYELRSKPTENYSGKFSAPGSSKEESFWICNYKKSNTEAFMGEGPIDILSYIQLKGFNPNATYMATTGRFGQRKGQHMIDLIKSTAATKISFLNDNDIHGQSYNLMLASIISNYGNEKTYPYVKARGLKNGSISITISNSNNLFKRIVDQSFDDINYLTMKDDYIALDAKYSIESINKMIEGIQRVSKGPAMKNEASKSKDWNKDLENSLEINHEKQR
ncbi:MAG: toprim domain-containing protein, partial [Marinoscillum sp.]